MSEQTKKSYLYNTVAAVVITLLITWQRGVFSAQDSRQLLVAWADGFGLSAMLLLALAFLSWSARQGTLDAVGYSVHRATRGGKKQPEDGEPVYTNYYDYLQAKKAQRETLPSLRPRFVVGLVTLAIGVALNVAFAVLY